MLFVIIIAFAAIVVWALVALYGQKILAGLARNTSEPPDLNKRIDVTNTQELYDRIYELAKYSLDTQLIGSEIPRIVTNLLNEALTRGVLSANSKIDLIGKLFDPYFSTIDELTRFGFDIGSEDMGMIIKRIRIEKIYAEVIRICRT